MSPGMSPALPGLSSRSAQAGKSSEWVTLDSQEVTPIISWSPLYGPEQGSCKYSTACIIGPI